jgi:hypothetical protein
VSALVLFVALKYHHQLLLLLQEAYSAATPRPELAAAA